MNFLENEFFLLAVTFGVFFLAKLLQKKTGVLLLNPILLTIAVLISRAHHLPEDDKHQL